MPTTLESDESRNRAGNDFLEPAQSPPSIGLNCGDLMSFVSSYWFGYHSFIVARFSAISMILRFYSIS